MGIRTDSKLEGHLLVGLEFKCQKYVRNSFVVRRNFGLLRSLVAFFYCFSMCMNVFFLHFQSALLSQIVWFIAQSEVLSLSCQRLC